MRQYPGDDTAFPRSFGIPDDGDADMATTFNVPYEALGDRTAWARAQIAAIGGKSWPFKSSSPVGGPSVQAIWDPVFERWVVSNPEAISWTQDYGVQWTNLAALSEVESMAAHPTLGRIVAWTGFGPFYLDGFDGQWTKGTGFGSDANNSNIIPITALRYYGAGQSFVGVGTQQGATPSQFTAIAATSPDGTAWTSHDVPAAVQAGAGWKLAVAPHILIALSAGGGTAPQFLMSSTDGITWTQLTSLVVPAGDFVADIGYNRGDGEFLAITRQGRSYATVDGVSWGLRSTIRGWVPLCLDSFGFVWFGIGMLNGDVAQGQIRISHDGGVTWKSVGIIFRPDQASASELQYHVFSSGTQGMATDTITIYFSQDMG